MSKINFSGIQITEIENDSWKSRPQKPAIAERRCFLIKIQDDIEKKCYCDNLDKVLLYALELKHEGLDGNFSEYADSMLKLGDDSELWR